MGDYGSISSLSPLSFSYNSRILSYQNEYTVMNKNECEKGGMNDGASYVKLDN